MKWQPIETAPKDGRNMLLFGRWWSDEQGRMKEPLIGQWNTARDRWEFANAEGWWGIRPECWMPLPDTPSNAELCGRPVRAVRTSAGLCLRRKGLMMDDPNMYAYGDHYPDDSDQPLPLPPEGHPLRKLGQRLTELLDEDHWAECERLLLEGWEHDRIDRKTGADWRQNSSLEACG
jgi:hypothetical protein